MVSTVFYKDGTLTHRLKNPWIKTYFLGDTKKRLCFLRIERFWKQLTLCWINVCILDPLCFLTPKYPICQSVPFQPEKKRESIKNSKGFFSLIFLILGNRARCVLLNYIVRQPCLTRSISWFGVRWWNRHCLRLTSCQRLDWTVIQRTRRQQGLQARGWSVAGCVCLTYCHLQQEVTGLWPAVWVETVQTWSFCLSCLSADSGFWRIFVWWLDSSGGSVFPLVSSTDGDAKQMHTSFHTHKNSWSKANFFVATSTNILSQKFTFFITTQNKKQL